MTHRTRKILSILLLVFGLPVYIVVASTLVSTMERPHILVELAIYVGLGVLWALPLRPLVRGTAREDPAARDTDQS